MYTIDVTYVTTLKQYRCEVLRGETFIDIQFAYSVAELDTYLLKHYGVNSEGVAVKRVTLRAITKFDTLDQQLRENFGEGYNFNWSICSTGVKHSNGLWFAKFSRADLK